MATASPISRFHPSPRTSRVREEKGCSADFPADHTGITFVFRINSGRKLSLRSGQFNLCHGSISGFNPAMNVLEVTERGVKLSGNAHWVNKACSPFDSGMSRTWRIIFLYQVTTLQRGRSHETNGHGFWYGIQDGQGVQTQNLQESPVRFGTRPWKVSSLSFCVAELGVVKEVLTGTRVNERPYLHRPPVRFGTKPSPDTRSSFFIRG
ncbi:hypothetical protein C8R46DRAFT_1041083 [Mycena filopes]|nr:hypothetical protein C8R46DRAFT_1041083 [Mycena filopes]